MLDRKKLAVIHIVKKELNLSDREYCDALESITGVRTARELDESGFRRLMNHFARSGYYRINRDGLTLRQKIFIRGLKEQLGWDERHFRNFLKKYYGKEEVETLSEKEAIKLIESLKNVLKHREEPKEGRKETGP